MEVKLAKIISVIFQPLIVPSIMLLILFSLNSYLSLMIPASAKNTIFALIFITTFLFPAIFILILYKRKLIQSISMEDKEERILPLFITAVFYALAFYIIWKIQIHGIYQRMFFGSAILVVFAMIISAFWKISAHMIGVGGLLGGLIGVSQVILIDLTVIITITIGICGLVAFARLKLNAHKPAQVYAGLLAGVVVMLMIFLL